jgi:hypothetical protein
MVIGIVNGGPSRDGYIFYCDANPTPVFAKTTVVTKSHRSDSDSSCRYPVYYMIFVHYNAVEFNLYDALQLFIHALS